MTADIFDEREDWHGPIGVSVALHALLFGGILIYGALRGGYQGEAWGGTGSGGSAISATLVSSVPLPARTAPTENVLEIGRASCRERV